MSTTVQASEQQALERISPDLLLLEVRIAMQKILDMLRARLAVCPMPDGDGSARQALRPEIILKLGLDSILKTRLGLIIENEDLRLYLSIVIAPIMPASLIHVMHSKRPKEVLAVIEEMVGEIDTAPFYIQPKLPG